MLATLPADVILLCLKPSMGAHCTQLPTQRPWAKRLDVPNMRIKTISCIPQGCCASVQAFQHQYAWSEEDPALAAAGDLGRPMFCFETAIKASVAQGPAEPQAGCVVSHRESLHTINSEVPHRVVNIMV